MLGYQVASVSPHVCSQKTCGNKDAGGGGGGGGGGQDSSIASLLLLLLLLLHVRQPNFTQHLGFGASSAFPRTGGGGGSADTLVGRSVPFRGRPERQQQGSTTG